jgi:ankyrin repeat protein
MPVDAALPGSADYVDLHELAKGWKAAIARAQDPATRHEAQIKNDRGNLPLHSAASFRAPLDVIGEYIREEKLLLVCK